MSIEVSLLEVVGEMDVPNAEWVAYLNRKTGELFTVTDEERRAVEQPVAHLPQWQAEELPKLREIFSSKDWLALPSKEDIPEDAIMESFCRSMEPESLRDDFLHAVKGPGGALQFMNLVERYAMEEEWHAFREESLEEIAADWLDAHGIAYKVDIPPTL